MLASCERRTTAVCTAKHSVHKYGERERERRAYAMFTFGATTERFLDVADFKGYACRTPKQSASRCHLYRAFAVADKSMRYGNERERKTTRQCICSLPVLLTLFVSRSYSTHRCNECDRCDLVMQRTHRRRVSQRVARQERENKSRLHDNRALRSRFSFSLTSVGNVSFNVCSRNIFRDFFRLFIFATAHQSSQS